MKRVILALTLPAILLAAWQYASGADLLSPVFFPAPLRAFSALYTSFVNGTVWAPLSATTIRMVQGWLVACLLGASLGALIGTSVRARAYLNPMLEFIRPFPASAIIPAAILIFGYSNTMTVFVIAFGSVWPVLLSTLHGFSTIEPRLKEVSDTLELSTAEYVRKIALPSTLPDMFTGLRISLAIALILAVVVEMQAGSPGLGHSLLLAQRMFKSPDVYAGIIILGLLGLVTGWLLSALESYVVAWKAQ